ncbi:divalent metal cation transporter [Streptomyces sp. 8K308]|uniref:divalent metal cation transporter n=1 Tax=Streptomyces sp. 8K308 TaxID=2530388 RepID=UPI001A9F643B|nr:divalent metal cation transporter [Streptomyces sp. 8K308]
MSRPLGLKGLVHAWTGRPPAPASRPPCPPGSACWRVGTNFSISAAFYTGYAARERGLSREQYRTITLGDTIPGIVAPGLMTILAIIVAAVAVDRGGTDSTSLAQLAGVLEPVAGTAGSKVFALGFFAAAFSSVIADATAGGTLLADGIGWGNALDNRRVKALICLVLTFGLAVTLINGGKSPEQLLNTAQALTVVFAPVLGVLLFVLANNAELMGPAPGRTPWASWDSSRSSPPATGS